MRVKECFRVPRVWWIVIPGLLVGAPWSLLGDSWWIMGLTFLGGGLGGAVGGMLYDWYTERRGQDRGAGYF